MRLEIQPALAVQERGECDRDHLHAYMPGRSSQENGPNRFSMRVAVTPRMQ